MKETPMKAVIVDDEADARDMLRRMLDRHGKEVEVVAEAGSADQAMECIRQWDPDILFLDVRMPYASGFDLLQRLPDLRAQLIFTTAYEHFALKAIKVSALDYLLKPIDPVELKTALKLAREKVGEADQSDQIKALVENIRTSPGRIKRLVIPGSTKYAVIDVASVVRCLGEGNYTTIFTLDGQQVMISKTLREYELILQNSGFFRIYQSHLINLDHVKFYYRGKGGTVEMVDGTVLPVSRTKKKEFLEALSGVD